ncbi:hypothetical protein CALVIDRAFT_541293 [Calocera viscosa TUFC12733]|uniref:F-box domain-containing protein n=1 Tax=Calocera viscosa (strain TUFC12733) TaxID=1330018 RepID=A0A167HXZ1_CALVF|nr:hypothetical protein CALVIDRAFT_541293 [Calocera viscosa TUFC12733]
MMDDLSSIEHLPVELLNEIFDHLDTSAALSCAQVCRLWLAAARRVLYRRIELSHQDLDRSVKLGHTLLICTEARHSVRHIKITVDAHTDDVLLPHLAWINDVREGQIQKVVLDDNTSRPSLPLLTSLLLKSPAGRSAQFLQLYGSFFDDDFHPSGTRAIELQNLRRMNISFAPGYDSPSWMLVHFPRLLMLDIKSSGYSPAMSVLLRTVSTSLQLLWLTWRTGNTDMGTSLQPCDQASLTGALSALTRLLSLSVDLNLSQPAAVLDDAMPHLVSLKVLTCCRGAFSEVLFSRLPPTVVLLMLGSNTNDGFPRDNKFLRHGWIAAARVRSGESALKYLWYFDHGDADIEREFAEECQNAGIDFLSVGLLMDSNQD